MIRQAFLAICFLATPALGAEIFRWVDVDGRTHFSDRRPPDAAVQRIVPQVGANDAKTVEAADPTGDPPSTGPYSLLAILAPLTGAVLEQPSDTLEISLQLEPALHEGHRLELLLDARPVTVETGSTRLQMQGVGFGAHRLQARIQDGLGKTIATTPVHELELRESVPPGVLP